MIFFPIEETCMYTLEEKGEKKPIENVIEIRTMCREQEICKGI